jgi:hypothetical protein
VYVHICQALRSDLTKYFGILSYHWVPHEQCSQVKIVNLERFKRLLKYQSSRETIPRGKRMVLLKRMSGYDFDRLELEGLHIEVGLFGPVAVMTQQCGEEPILTLLIKECDCRGSRSSMQDTR